MTIAHTLRSFFECKVHLGLCGLYALFVKRIKKPLKRQNAIGEKENSFRLPQWTDQPDKKKYSKKVLAFLFIRLHMLYNHRIRMTK